MVFVIFVNHVMVLVSLNRPVARSFNWVVLLYKTVDLFNKILDLLSNIVNLFNKIVDFLTNLWFFQAK